MSDEFIFDQSAYTVQMEPRGLSQETNELWSNSTVNNTLSESFMTANDNGDNTSQYFSVLESSCETILNDMTQTNMDMTAVADGFALGEEQNDNPEVDGGGNQEVVLFRVDDSENLYGVQIAQDADGNLQKYQFQVVQNEQGHFETVPDTIQIVPFDSDEIMLQNTEPAYEEQEDEPVIDQQVQHEVEQQMQENEVFIKTEYTNNEDSADTNPADNQLYIQEQEEENTYSNSCHEELNLEDDTKEGILEKALKGNQPYVYEKEVHEEEEYSEQLQEDIIPNIQESQETECIDEQKVLSFQQIFIEGNPPYDEDSQNKSLDCHEYEETEEMIEENGELVDENEDMLEENGIIIEEEHEEDEMLDEEGEILHERNEIYISEEEEEDGISVESYDEPYMEEIDEDYINDVHFTESEDGNEYQQVIIEQKDLTHYQQIKDSTNLHKILKLNRKPGISYIVRSTEKENLEMQKYQKVNPRSVLKTSMKLKEDPDDPGIQKKNVKPTKISIAKKLFHHSLAQTTILQAPIRQERLPRKQKIQPLERSGEEIVVQEVVVSSNGYIETREDGVLRERKPLVATECIQIPDSDEDSSNGKKRKRKSKKKNKQVEIIISDSDDDNSNENKDPEETEIECTKCSESFTSTGSLKTHMQYHHFEESNIKNLSKINLSEKYKCPICNETFKNNILLTKHKNLHKDINGKIECSLCKKLFADRKQLTVHKRTHVKEQMFNSTSLEKIAPKKKSPKKSDQFKCEDCGKVFSSALLLSSHAKSHKRITCPTCAKTFTSKIIFDNHRLRDCVKSPKRAQVATATTAAAAATGIPRRTVRPMMAMRCSKRLSMKNESNNLTIKVTCDTCHQVFTSYTLLFKHKVIAHGLDTPDKSVRNGVGKRTLAKPVGEHSGVPANGKLVKAFDGLRKKLDIS